jgi:hypothetical protein
LSLSRRVAADALSGTRLEYMSSGDIPVNQMRIGGTMMETDRLIETCYMDETAEDFQHDASLSFSITLLGAETSGIGDEPPELVSHASDVGPEGMALLLPSLPFMYRYLLGPDYTLRFTLHLPDGPIWIEAAPVYDRPLQDADMNLGFIVTGSIVIEATPRQYERYEPESAEVCCMIGVRIKKMSDHDRARYQEYLDMLEIERSVKILTDESDAIQADETKESDAARSSFAQRDARPRYSSAAPYEYS